MSPLAADVRRLVAEAGLAAVNHGLNEAGEQIRQALADLVEDEALRSLLDAAMLIGLGRADAAASVLEGNSSSEAQLLRTMLRVPGTPAHPPSPLTSPPLAGGRLIR